MTFGGENKQDFLSPGTDSKAAIELLDERFPTQAGDTVTIVIHDDAGVTSPDVRRGRRSHSSNVSASCPTSSAWSRRGIPDGVGSGLGRRHDRLRDRATRQHERPVPGQRRRPR